MLRLSLLIALVASASASAQTTPDPTPAERYYPLAVGNEWVYLEGFETVAREAVVGDSVVAGETFAVVERTVIGSNRRDTRRDTTRWLVRVDPATATVITLGADGERQSDGCPLDTDFPARSSDNRAVSCGNVPATVSGGPDQPIWLAFPSTDEVVATLKAFHLSDDSRVEYAAGIGRTASYRRRAGDVGFTQERLVYAVIDGQAVGPVPTPDPTDPALYYPLTVGTERERLSVYPSRTPATLYTRSVIARDTVVAGVRYAVAVGYQAEREGDPWQRTGQTLLRFDRPTTRVVRLAKDGTETFGADSLGAAFGQFVVDSGTGYVRVVMGRATPTTVEVRQDRVPVPAIKGFYSLAYGFADTDGPPDYAAGIGPLPPGGGPCTFCQDGFTFLRLVDADGTVREYGARFAVATDGAPQPSTLTLTAGPNPSAGPLAVVLNGATGAGTVQAFDALGRRVWQQTVTLGAGRQRVEIDAAAWAPGLYVVRATAGGQTATARVVRQ